MKLKNLSFLFLCSVLTFSCSDSHEDLMDDGNEDPTKSTRVAGDGKYESLGYGYDITGEFLSDYSIKRPVIDVEKFVNENNHRFEAPFLGTTTTRIYGGDNFSSYIKNIQQENNVNASLNVIFSNKTEKDRAQEATFSGEVTNKSMSKYSYSSKYSFARADIAKRQRRYYMDSNPSILSNYLSKNFKEDLELLTDDQIVNRYGTHVLTNIEVGGYYRCYYSSVIINEKNEATKTKAAKGGITVLLKKVGLNINASSQDTENTIYETLNSEWDFYAESYGGTRNGYSISISNNTGNVTQNVSFDNWSASVDDTHSVLTNINWEYAYPIYDLVKDPTRKNKLKEAVKKYILSKKVDVVKVVPLIQWYDTKGKCYLYVTDANYNPGSNWYLNGVKMYVYAENEPGSTPLVQWYDSKDGCYAYMPGTGVFNTNKSWSSQGIKAYLPSRNEHGTIPVYQWYDSKDKCYAYMPGTAPFNTNKSWHSDGLKMFAFSK